MLEKKTYTLQEVAESYCISVRTLRDWLMPISKDLLKLYPSPRKRLTLILPKQLELINSFLA